MNDPTNAIRMGQTDRLGETSHEIARLWVTHDGPSTVYINVQLLRDPRLFGMLLADAAHHGARAYARTWGITEAEALSLIWQGLDAERTSSGEFETIETDGGNA